MTMIKALGISAALTAGLLLAAGSANAGSHCVRAGASAVGVTKEMTTLLAKEGLYQSNLLAGRKGRGAVNVTCKYEGVVTTCTARQVACK